MSTPKEIFLELLKPDGQPERQLRQYEALSMCLTDPINTYLRGNRRRGTVEPRPLGHHHQLSGGRPRSHSASRQGAHRLSGCHPLAGDGARPRPE